MRRAARKALPALSFHFGIKPWEVDDLTYGEIQVYMAALKKLPPLGWVITGVPKK